MQLQTYQQLMQREKRMVKKAGQKDRHTCTPFLGNWHGCMQGQPPVVSCFIPRLIIVHGNLLIVKRQHISMAYGRKVTTLEGLLIWNVLYCCLLANGPGINPAMVLALLRTMSKVLEVSLMPYSPSPPPSPSGPTCPSSYQAQKAAPFKALPLLMLCKH